MRPCFDPLALSLAAPYLCRWWLCRRKIAQGFEAYRRMDGRNHQTFRHGAGLRSSAPQMGCRTYFRMARSLSQTGKGFRSDNRQRSCLGARRSHPHPHKTDRKSFRSITIIMSRTLRSVLDAAVDQIDKAHRTPATKAKMA